MAGAGYKLFNTGDVLTAQQVNEYLQQQTVMVFASSTARTTALSGVLAEGMMSYLQDTNSVEVYNGSAWVGVASDQIPLTTKGDLLTYSTTDTRLPVGTNGQYLVADSTTATGLKWGDVSAGGYTLLSTTSLSGSSTTISSISGAYTDLMMQLIGFRTTSGTSTLWIRFNNDTGANYSTYYTRSTNLIQSSTDQSSIQVNYDGGPNSLGASTFTNYVLTIPNYANDSVGRFFTLQGSGGSTWSSNMINNWGVYNNSTSAISSITFLNNQGWTMTGTVRIYGVK